MEKIVTLPIVGRVSMKRCYSWPTLGAAVFAAMLLLVLHRPDPVTFLESRFEPTEAYAGAEVTLHRTVIWNRLCRVEAAQFWVGEQGQVWKFTEPKVIPVPAEEGKFVSQRPQVIPKTLMPGMWKFRIVDRGQCWPWEYWFPISMATVDTPIKVIPRP